MIAGTLLMNRFAQNLSKTHLVLWGLLTMGAFVVVLAAFKSIAAASISMFGVGVGVVFVFVSAQTLMQGQTPMELIGRVSSSFMSVLSIAQLIGLVFSGSMAQTLGIRNLFYGSAAMLLLITVFGYFRLPQQPAISAGTPEQQPGD
jgi:DHA3 family macrolide efflux protein-like MFS transporter